MKKPLKVPKFTSEDSERQFWGKLDLTDFFDGSDFDAASFPNLKPSSYAISIRIPQYLLIRVKETANELDIPYQSLIKRYIAQGVFKKP